MTTGPLSPNEDDPGFVPAPSARAYLVAKQVHELERQRDMLRQAIFLERRGTSRRTKLEAQMAGLTTLLLRLQKENGR